jgi:hypothetical protein
MSKVQSQADVLSDSVTVLQRLTGASISRTRSARARNATQYLA